MAARRKALGWGAALGLALAGWSLPAASQSLEEALANAYLTNPTLLAARAELRSVNEGVPQALSAWRPQVSVNGDVGFETTKLLGQNQKPSSGLAAGGELTVSQTIYSGGSIRASVDSAEAVVFAQRALLADTEQSILLAAVTAYIDVWQAKALLDLNIANEERLRRQREATVDRFDVGEVTRTDVSQADARLAGATAERVAAEGDLATARSIFYQIIGLVPSDVQQAEPIAILPRTLQETVALAQQDAPNLVAARFLENSALSDIRAQLGALLPQVSLVGLVGYDRNNSTSVGIDNIETFTATIVAQVSVPLYQQGLVASQVRQAKQIASRRRLEITEALRQAEQDGVTAWESLVTARAQITSFESQVRANTVALEGVEQESLVGARTVLDVLDAEQELLQAQVSLVGAQRDEVVAAYQVSSAIGRLTAANLNLGVAIYNPRIDYDKVRNAWFGLDAPGAN
ncbi:MAG: TolC family outer membrane protein [Rhodospirillales bacterium]